MTFSAREEFGHGRWTRLRTGFDGLHWFARAALLKRALNAKLIAVVQAILVVCFIFANILFWRAVVIDFARMPLIDTHDQN